MLQTVMNDNTVPCRCVNVCEKFSNQCCQEAKYFPAHLTYRSLTAASSANSLVFIMRWRPQWVKNNRHKTSQILLLIHTTLNVQKPGVWSLPEPLRREEVEQVEKLLQVVLQRSSSQQQFVLQRVVVQDPEKLQRRKQRTTCLQQLQLSAQVRRVFNCFNQDVHK